MFSCKPEDLVRNIGFIRNYFYPEVYERKGIGENTEGECLNHSEYAYVLNKYVDNNGFVNYSGLAGDINELDDYLEKVSKVQLDKLSKYSRISVLLNAYNGFTLKLILENHGIRSIQDIPERLRWKDKRWILGGMSVSLDHIEHEILRKTFGDPRIHFALVCAAKSCPKLRNEPYTEEKLVEQLEDQAQNFFLKESNFRWNSKEKTLYLSEIFDWFRYDFADDEMGVVNYILKYLDKNAVSEISKEDDIKIKYITYDWSLNGTWE